MIARLFQYLIILLMVAMPVSGFAAPMTASLAPGLNVVGVTATLAADQASAFPLLTAWQAAGVTAIEAYDAANATMLRAALDGDGNPSGADFPLVENSALYVYSSRLNTLSLGDSSPCAPLNLAAGFNLASHACFPADYLASDFMTSVGIVNITSLSRLDLSSGRWQTAAVDGGVMVGDDFPLIAGEGYIIHSTAVNGWRSPLSASIDLSPLTSVTGLNFTYKLTINLSAVAPAGGYPVTLAAEPAGLVSVPASTIVPAGASSVQVTVSAAALGTATITATSPAWEGSAAHTVTIRPTQSVNYTPLTSAQVGVQVGPVNTAPTSVSPIYTPVSSAQVGVMVTPAAAPIDTSDYGPVTAMVGVLVAPEADPNRVTLNYTPLTSGEVGVAVGPVMTGLIPNRGAIGSTALLLTITGIGLNDVTAIEFLPATGITIGALAVAPDGLSVTVAIDIAANATLGGRTVLARSASEYIKPSVGRADLFTITLPTPEIYSIAPLRAMAGQSVTMTVNGKNFASASSVNLTPTTGILVNNPPTISPDGSSITTTFSIAANAPITSRVVTVTTPGGTTDGTATPANTFSVTSASDPGTPYTAATSEVGVLVDELTVPPTHEVLYGPAIALPVGVTVGSTLTVIAPISGAIGDTALKVRAVGVGLSDATGMTFYPPEGITIQPGSFAIGDDGNPEVIVDIAADAALTARAVFVTLATGGYALPTNAGSDQFHITLPQPEIYSIEPLRAMAGQAVTMTINGKNFASASRVDFSDPAGIVVSNPPTISPDGTTLTSNFTLAGDAALGSRVVSVTTPAGVTSTTGTPANTFTVTADAGTTYATLPSTSVGVLVAPAGGSEQLVVDFGPLPSLEVGVMVALEAAPPSQEVDYTPILATEVGVAVGGVFTGFSPTRMEPGSSVSFTINGVGLDAVTAMTVIPSDHLMVTDWLPAADGLSCTVTITADAGASHGSRTLVPLVGNMALPPTVAVIDLLQIGYRPIIDSISTDFPDSSVLADIGATVTLTLSGEHLQEVTGVEILPADGITIDTVPVWYSDATGEHVRVTVVVTADAALGDRLIRLTTRYGRSSDTLDTTNTLSIIDPTVVTVAPVGAEPRPVALPETVAGFDNDQLTGGHALQLFGLSLRKLDTEVLLPMQLQSGSLKFSADSLCGIVKVLKIASTGQVEASRGPPTA